MILGELTIGNSLPEPYYRSTVTVLWPSSCTAAIRAHSQIPLVREYPVRRRQSRCGCAKGLPVDLSQVEEGGTHHPPPF